MYHPADPLRGPGLTQVLGITLTVFGNPEIFALELEIEPDPSIRFMGNEPLGRIRVWISGNSFGCREEPSCPFAALVDELWAISDRKFYAWNPSLEPRTPSERFHVLDDLLFGPGGADRVPSSLDCSSFLTNTVECFNDLKGFVLTPSDEALQVMVLDQLHGRFGNALVPKDFMREIATNALDWAKSNRRDA